MLTPLKEPATQSVLLQSIISGGRLTRRDSVPGLITSQSLDWPGVLLKAGTNDVAAVDDVVGDRHYLSLNVDTKPLTLEVKGDRKSTRLNSSHQIISYAVFCLKKKKFSHKYSQLSRIAI